MHFCHLPFVKYKSYKYPSLFTHKNSENVGAFQFFEIIEFNGSSGMMIEG